MRRRMIPVTNGPRKELRSPPPVFGGLLGSWFNPMFQEPWPAFRSGALALDRIAPTFRIAERDDEIVVRAELPGIEAENLQVEVEGDRLTVAGEIRHEREERIDGGVHLECGLDSFQRTLTLPVAVDAEQATAGYADGVLTVTLPTVIETRPKKVGVRRKK